MYICMYVKLIKITFSSPVCINGCTAFVLHVCLVVVTAAARLTRPNEKGFHSQIYSLKLRYLYIHTYIKIRQKKLPI